MPDPRTMEYYYYRLFYELKVIATDDLEMILDYSKTNPLLLARTFIEFFNLKYPLTLEQLLAICQESNIAVETLPDHLKARGTHVCCENHNKIFYKEKDSLSGKIQTILHELYEITDDFLYGCQDKEKPRQKKEIEKKANQFAAYVQVPNEMVIQWINLNSLDIFGLQNHLTCSYVTALIRLNEVLCEIIRKETKKHIPLICLLYERPYWKETTSGRAPKLQLKLYVKSRGFPFTLIRNDLKYLNFFSGERNGFLSLQNMVTIYSKPRSDKEVLLKDVEMFFEDTHMPVDILVRKVNWKKYKHTAKILFQIMPSEQIELRCLANKLNIKENNSF